MQIPIGITKTEGLAPISENSSDDNPANKDAFKKLNLPSSPWIKKASNKGMATKAEISDALAASQILKIRGLKT